MFWMSFRSGQKFLEFFIQVTPLLRIIPNSGLNWHSRQNFQHSSWNELDQDSKMWAFFFPFFFGFKNMHTLVFFPTFPFTYKILNFTLFGGSQYSNSSFSLAISPHSQFLYHFSLSLSLSRSLCQRLEVGWNLSKNWRRGSNTNSTSKLNLIFSSFILCYLFYLSQIDLYPCVLIIRIWSWVWWLSTFKKKKILYCVRVYCCYLQRSLFIFKCQVS